MVLVEIASRMADCLGVGSPATTGMLHQFVRLTTRRLVVLLAAVLLAGCGDGPDSPEAELQALVAQAEQRAQERDRSGLMALVSDRYSDSSGRGRDELNALLRLHFIRNRNVHLLTRIHSMELSGPSFARLELLVAMAARPFSEDEQSLLTIRTDVVRLHLELRREDAWQVVSASWRRATPAEFLGVGRAVIPGSGSPTS